MQMLGVDVIVMMVVVRMVPLYRGVTHDDAQRVQLVRDVAGARAITAAARGVLPRRRASRENPQQRCTRRRGELTRPWRAVTDVESLEQSDRRRCRHRQQAVGRLHRAIAQCDAGVVDTFYSK